MYSDIPYDQEDIIISLHFFIISERNMSIHTALSTSAHFYLGLNLFHKAGIQPPSSFIC